jgi:hypothetical protein
VSIISGEDHFDLEPDFDFEGKGKAVPARRLSVEMRGWTGNRIAIEIEIELEIEER